MPSDCISYQKSGYFSKLIVDYLNQDANLQSLYHRFPTVENFEQQILEKRDSFDLTHRNVLVSVLKKQYDKSAVSALTQQNIEALSQPNTFTVTTGHQLNLFTGPLYFLYKIISTINLTRELKEKYPTYHFIPIYWMATEDHDFEEINYFSFKGKKIRWNKESKGPVGRLSTEGLDKVLDALKLELGTGNNATSIKKSFQDAYLNHDNLTDSTRYLANMLFGDYGIVILDADNADLKREFIPFIKDELLHQTSNKSVLETAQKLKEYTIQVNPREINLFYLEDNLRERIILEGGTYKINNTSIAFTRAEIIALLESHPEKFSPNVIMRPLYQEVVLPNLCYVGGGGEISYWLELKSYFDAVNITFPILLLRNSVLLVTEKQYDKAEKLDLTWEDLFAGQEDLVNKKVKVFSEFPINFSEQKYFLKKQFEDLHRIANQTDNSFLGAVNAQESKQLKGLEHLEKRLLKAQKRKHSSELQRITDLQNELFPNHGLQERTANFSEYYIEYGIGLIKRLTDELQPLDKNFSIVKL
ncbi:bacillithiol biosynthesis cysteine-adding enzyme BshC [Flavobacterium sp. GT3R68]|uniref:bacillithiol biosynthesis cysteine-adding enzyme BshC n=1 Tax=Flavobacterium sp. GT3R68 TaxID=2594437 RepID=UPI000F88E908|nr:bacillithiol biosynthesis cysteine-adding enzyme BshC [Flavobacterium sp. GT3R68]RTY86618.1 bacillithiol biosynthesis cysteine-adding enzyme BshC [Flavobacterium sp. GSN2]TRW92347.1 bacillithiol biosynthesis cysteine-adding enzyme BshC [Flavobacterium sp. GT3R68]